STEIRSDPGWVPLPTTMPSKERHMGKWFAIGIVSAVFAVIAGMWFMFDRRLGKPNAAWHRNSLGTAETGAEGGTAFSAAREPKMVQPESLEQGFIVVVFDKSRVASASTPIYMPSSHNGWNPGDAKMKLEPQSDSKWRITWEKPKLDSRIAFKFARGS